MKIILGLFIVCLYISPALAYKEDSRVGETQLTAGEQNSNLHKLSSRGVSILKKLKQADSYVERVQSSGKQVRASALEDLLNSEQKDRVEIEIEKLTAEVRRQITEAGSLKVTPSHEVYTMLTQMGSEQQKDKATASQLAAQLQRRK